jgi:hypothetical protein
LLAGGLAWPAGATISSPPPGYRQVASEVGVPSTLLYAVALAESGRVVGGWRTARPWPWTLNLAGRGRYYRSRLEAYAALRQALDAGRASVDIGLMQVNWRFHRAALRDPWAALDPFFNLRAGARILRQCYQRLRDWWQAVGCYHAPGRSAAQRRRATVYRERVKRHWGRLG